MNTHFSPGALFAGTFRTQMSIVRGPFLASLLAISSFQTAGAEETGGVRERALFNEGWRFTKGDPAGAGEKLKYTNDQALGRGDGRRFHDQRAGPPAGG